MVTGLVIAAFPICSNALPLGLCELGCVSERIHLQDGTLPERRIVFAGPHSMASQVALHEKIEACGIRPLIFPSARFVALWAAAFGMFMRYGLTACLSV